MRFRGVILVILSSLLLCLPIRAEKRAYLVCIGEYAKGTDWGPISAANDLELLQETLSDEFVIESISDGEATYDGVVSFLRGIADEISPGDIVLVHFSSHGQQMFTLSDVSEPDGLDEAIIPYDANKYYSSSYHGEHHLRDDEIDAIFNQIRHSIGENGLLFVLFDACHSDSLYKGKDDSTVNGQILRGTGEIFGPETSDAIIDSLKEIKYAQEPFNVNKEPGFCDVVYVSACQASGKNVETVVDGIGYGSLSYAFAEAYKNEGGLNENLPDLLSSIRDQMKNLHPFQDPVFHSSLPIVLNEITGSGTEADRHPHVLRRVILGAIIISIIALIALCIARTIRKHR
jgi:hypothetical protein